MFLWEDERTKRRDRGPGGREADVLGQARTGWRIRARTRMSKRTRSSDRCEAETGFRRKAEPEPFSPMACRSGGRRDRTCEVADLWERESYGLVEGRVAALRSDASCRIRPNAKAPGTCPRWPEQAAEPGTVCCPQGRCCSGQATEKCEHPAPRGPGIACRRSDQRRGSSHQEQASGARKATGARQQCRAFFRPGAGRCDSNAIARRRACRLDRVPIMQQLSGVAGEAG